MSLKRKAELLEIMYQKTDTAKHDNYRTIWLSNKIFMEVVAKFNVEFRTPSHSGYASFFWEGFEIKRQPQI